MQHCLLLRLRTIFSAQYVLGALQHRLRGNLLARRKVGRLRLHVLVFQCERFLWDERRDAHHRNRMFAPNESVGVNGEQEAGYMELNL